MNRREIFDSIVRFRPVGTLVDFGGCPLSMADGPVLKRLSEFLGFAPLKSLDKRIEFAQTYEFDERISKHYDIDTRSVGFILMPPKPHHKVAEGGDIIVDEWGIVRRFTGQYWDIVESPLQDKSFEEIKNYPFPEIESLDLAALDEEAKRAKFLYENTDYIVIASHPVYGILEIACWMFGFEDLLYRLAAEPETVHMFFERYLNYQKEISALYYGKLGKYIHVTTSGDDFATQNSLMCSVPMFSEMIAPYLKERIRYTKTLTNAKFLHHSCGSVAPLIPTLVDCGVDILNPIQPCSDEMKPENLTRNYGNKIVFHGGFDTQAYLPNLAPQEIEEKVFELIKQMRGYSYIFAAAHNIQNDVPVENINALFEAAKKYKNYSE